MARVEPVDDPRGIVGGILAALDEEELKRVDELVAEGMSYHEATQQILKEIREDTSST